MNNIKEIKDKEEFKDGGATRWLFEAFDRTPTLRLIRGICTLLGSAAVLTLMVYIILMGFWTEEVPIDYKFLSEEKQPSFPPFWICGTLLTIMAVTFLPAFPYIRVACMMLTGKDGDTMFLGGTLVALTPIVSLIGNWYCNDLSGTSGTNVLYMLTVMLSIVYVPFAAIVNLSLLMAGIGCIIESIQKMKWPDRPSIFEEMDDPETLKEKRESGELVTHVTPTGIVINNFGVACFKRFSKIPELANEEQCRREVFKVTSKGITWPQIGFTLKREDIDPNFKNGTSHDRVWE